MTKENEYVETKRSDEKNDSNRQKTEMTAEEKYELNCRVARFYESGGLIDE
ncbi:MAG: hypothetical protein U9N81_12450 [Bacillota bacterium]|nr:hypothetical protein [Bacillota bacterium]